MLQLIEAESGQAPPESPTGATEERVEEPRCLACGADLTTPLRCTGSMRCHDCRADCAPLRAELVKLAAAGARAA